MKIITAGDLFKQPELKIRKFVCKRCGCVFEANSNEFKWADFFEARDGIEATCKCPCCERTVYLDKTR